MGKIMKQPYGLNRWIALGLLSFFCTLSLMPFIQATPLPPPQSIDMNLEQTMFRRMSIREFTNDSITDEQLATILWNAAGYRSDGNRTISGINGTFASIIYVLRADAAYTYDPVNHTLNLYKSGDWRDIVNDQYPGAPLVLGLCYNTTRAPVNLAGAEIGELCQNIAFTVDALNLGAVVTGGLPPAINQMGIPDDQAGLIVMPIGHLLHSYSFKYRPLWISLLPKVIETPLNLTTALRQRTETTSFQGTVTRPELSQLLWSSYGFSYNIDRSKQDLNAVVRHRTVPSAHGYYPLDIYAVTDAGVYRYQPNLITGLITLFSDYPVDFLGLPIVTFIQKIRAGDHRAALADACSLHTISTAPLSIIMVLSNERTHDAGEPYVPFWYLEAGAATQNIMLEATALGFHSNIALPTDSAALNSLLKLGEGFTPLLIVPVGS
jgi:nitroreductase